MATFPVIDARIGEATVNNSRTVYSALVLTTFDNEGNYNKTDWYDYQLISEQLMDKIEDGIYYNRLDLKDKYDNVIVEEYEGKTELSFYSFNKKLKTISITKDYNDLINKPTIPTKVSELENDSEYLTEHQDISHLALKTELPTKTSQLENDSNLATREELPTKVSQLENDSNYLTEVPSEYITETELEEELKLKSDDGHLHEQYLTEIPSAYITETELEDRGYLTNVSLQDYPTRKDMNDAIIQAMLDNDIDLSDYATVNNPKFENSISMNRNESSTVGAYSIGLGYLTVASGIHSIALGNNTHASAMGSISIGFSTISHGLNQIVLGRYNAEDTENKYAYLYGNGTSEDNRSNSHTLDWNGNAWFLGNVSIDGTPTNDNDLVTKSYVDTAIENIEIEDIDLSAYAKKEDIPSLDGYATKEYVDEKIEDIDVDIDLSEYAKKTDIPSLNGYATEKYVDEAISNIEIENIDLSDYALKTELHSHNNKTILDSITQENIDTWNNTKGMTDEEKEQLAKKYDDVMVIQEGEYVTLTFFSNGIGVKSVKFKNNDNGNNSSCYISTSLLETIVTPTNNDVKLPLYFYSPNEGMGALKVFINNTEIITTDITQGKSTITIPYNLLTNNSTLEVYVSDTKDILSNTLKFILKIVDEKTIANYTYLGSSNDNILPTFNDEYTNYTVDKIDNNNGTCTVNITTDNLDNLPSRIKFQNTPIIKVNYLNTSNVTTMDSMFFGCGVLTGLDVSNWDTSQVTNMQSMFFICNSLTSLDLSNWNTSNVTDMNSMFQYCNSLISLDISGWDTSRVNYMYNMFCECTNLTTLDGLEDFNTSNVTSIFGMFDKCNQLTKLNLSNWNTSQVTNMHSMFYECTNLTTLDVSKWNTSNVTNMGYMFAYCNNLTTLDVSKFNTSNVTNMNGMFNNCNKLTSLDLSNWNTSNVTDMASMFSQCNNLLSLDLSNWDIGQIKGKNLLSTFWYCTALTDFIAPKNIDESLDFSYSNNLTHDSLMSIINNLATVSSILGNNDLILGSTNLAKLTDSEIAIATSRGWDIA